MRPKRHPKIETIAAIEEARLVPLFFDRDEETGRHVADALFAGGCTVLEFTNRGAGAPAAFRSLVRHIRTVHPQAFIGAGSIHSPGDAAAFLAAGADFIVGAGFHNGVAALCAGEETLYVPGCATATEIMTATETGCGMVKIFPADFLGGPNFLKALRGPFPWLRAVPSGGVKATRDSLKNWFDAGAVAVCMGSDLVSADILRERKYAALRGKAAEITSLIRDLP